LDGQFQRVPRRFTDRLLSLLRPQHRYQCRVFDCGWQGTLPVVRSALRGSQDARAVH
jgi:hypothetical protein